MSTTAPTTPDALGRATFHHIEHRSGVRPTARELRWLKHIERHGCTSSVYLHELTSDTHRDPDTSRRQMQKLRAGGYLTCPRQQRATENASFNPYVYDLGDQARWYLREHGLDNPTVTPRGHWVHAYMASCVTGSIDIAAQRAGVSYIPAHAVLSRSGASLGTTIDNKSFIPDQLFGLDYGGRYRFFCVETDRGTEPKTSAQARKSYRSMAESYRRFIGEGLYKEHYGLTAGMLLLAVFSSRTNERRFLDIAREVIGTRSGYIMTQVLPEFHHCFRPPKLLTHLFDGEWQRATGDPFVMADT